jgi:GNAT superfamily N-acetyltransferase
MEGARPATDADVPRLAELVAEAVEEQREARGGAVWSQREAREVPAEASLKDAVTDPEQLVLTGTIDDYVVGYAVARTERLRDGSVLGIISDVYVEEGARAIGLGEVLVDQVVAWCTDRGCRGIDALALPGNRETKNFFESFGFTARAIVVHKRLA